MSETRRVHPALAQQESRQQEAAAVLDDLRLLPLLAGLGEPIQTGSVPLGLLVGRDIDVTVLCRELDSGRLFAAARPLAEHPRVRGLLFRNDTGHWNTDPAYPDGIYWRPLYRSPEGHDWTLDIWFIPEGSRQPDLEHLESLPPRLSDETRVAILQLKEAWLGRPDYSSYAIYEAVLDHSVRTGDELERFLRERET